MVIYRAQQLMEENKFTEAAEALEKFQRRSKELKPGEPDTKGYRHYLVDFTLGNCCLMTRNYSAAAVLYQKATTNDPDFHAGWMNLAKCRYETQEYAGAGHAFLKGYETAQEKAPETLYYGAVCFMTAGDNQKALMLFHRLLKEHAAGIKLEWKEAFVQAYLACDQPRKALPFIEELSEKTEGKKQNQWQKIRLHQYISLDMKTKALEYVKRLIREYPLESDWWKGLAHLHLKENRYRPALVALSIKGFIEPLTAREKRIIADLNMALEIPVEAVRFYERIAEDKFESDVAYRIAQGCLRLHRPEKALKWVERGLLEEKTPRLMLLKGALLYELERYREAAAAFETAAREKMAQLDVGVEGGVRFTVDIRVHRDDLLMAGLARHADRAALAIALARDQPEHHGARRPRGPDAALTEQCPSAFGLGSPGDRLGSTWIIRATKHRVNDCNNYQSPRCQSGHFPPRSRGSLAQKRRTGATPLQEYAKQIVNSRKKDKFILIWFQGYDSFCSSGLE